MKAGKREHKQLLCNITNSEVEQLKDMSIGGKF